MVLKPKYSEGEKKYYIQMIREITNYNMIAKHLSDVILSSLVRKRNGWSHTIIFVYHETEESSARGPAFLHQAQQEERDRLGQPALEGGRKEPGKNWYCTLHLQLQNQDGSQWLAEEPQGGEQVDEEVYSDQVQGKVDGCVKGDNSISIKEDDLEK